MTDKSAKGVSFKHAAGAVCPVVTLAAAAAFFVWGRFWCGNSTGDGGGIADVMRYYIPNWLFLRDALLRGTLPLWNPYEMLGSPTLATLEFGPFYAPNWFYMAMPIRAAYLWIGALHIFLAGVFMYGYLRNALRLGVVSSWYGGLVAAFSSWMVLHICHAPDTFHSAVWIPSILWLTDRLVRNPGPRPSLWLGAAMAMQFLAGESEITVRTGLMAAVYAAFRLGTRRPDWPTARRTVAWGMASGAIAFGFSAIQLLPAFELSMASVRKPGGLDFMAAFGDGISSRLELLRDMVAANVPISMLFIGLPTLALAAYALARPGKTELFFGLFGIATFELLRGTNSYATWLYYHCVPTGNWFRASFRFAPYLILSITVLAACGLCRFTEDLARWFKSEDPPTGTGRYWTVFAPVAWLAAGITASLVAGQYWASLDNSLAIILFVLIGMIILSGRSLLYFRKIRAASRLAIVPALAFSACFLVVAWESYPITDWNLPQNLDFVGLDTSMQRFLQEHAVKGQRVYADYALEDGRRVPKLGPLLNIACVDGQSPFVTEAYVNELRPYLFNCVAVETTGASADISVGLRGGLSLERDAADFFRLLGVRYLVLGLGNQAFGPPAFGWADKVAPPPEFQLMCRKGELAIFENTAAWPRAFLLKKPMDRPTVIGVPGQNIAAADIVAYEADRVVIHPPSNTPGVLVLTDQYFPGWRAWADGEPRAIEPVWNSFRGVRLTGREKEVVFRYRPMSQYLGAAITMCSIAATIGAGCLSMFQRKFGSRISGDSSKVWT